ncbi:hypothetical protein OG782_34990 [Streptomyces sp. NBC_00876]|uniref:hypothetical protein n=1 Tax=Streptomyces sp. NBC_00876 TaxID=2975853 RepID=UPI00386467A7|nr:hypothetical protein OG782_34990 [Streptomyces sp. NBC_00876]
MTKGIPDYPAQQAGDHWVLPTIEEVADGLVKMHVSVTVSAQDHLQDSDLQAEVTAGGRTLVRQSGPLPGPLATMELLSINAVGSFAFANPGDPPPSTVVVTVRGSQASFDVSDGSV